jgi:hypothetical protein
MYKNIPIFFRFIFPGLALGAALGQTGVVTNAMVNIDYFKDPSEYLAY